MNKVSPRCTSKTLPEQLKKRKKKKKKKKKRKREYLVLLWELSLSGQALLSSCGLHWIPFNKTKPVERLTGWQECHLTQSMVSVKAGP